MAHTHPLPAGDSEFDTLQAILVAAVSTNAVDWDILAAEITKLTDKQTIWAAAWLIAKDKQNSTSAQKKAKDLARKNYEKVLRPFIQKWIYRNEAMDDSDVEQCGLKPRDTTHTPATKPTQPVAIAKRGEPGELIGSCAAVSGAKRYNCIVTEGAPLPDGFNINDQGRIVWSGNNNPNPDPNAPVEPKFTGLIVDLTEQRVKKFSGLKPGSTYYIYFFASNAAGVSILSAPVSMVCW